MLGYNGNIDENASYDSVKHVCKHSNVYSFKDLFGEQPSVISLGFWYGCQLLMGAAPVNKPLRSINEDMNNLLLFNKYKDEVSIILIKKS